MNKSKQKSIIIYTVIIFIYVLIFLILDKLNFAIRKDEIHFWPTALKFSKSWLPSIELLKNYGELNTPLPFIIFGSLEHVFNGGIVIGRLFNLMLSLCILFFFTYNRKQKDTSYVYSLIGLLLFPYFILCATHLYTDIIATFCVFAGFLFYLKKRNLVSCILFILAVSSRQHMLAFPFGILVFEIIKLIKESDCEMKGLIRKVAFYQFIACTSFLAWFLFWGNFGPSTEIAIQNVSTVSAFRIYPEYSLYFLSCIGFYFVIPEIILFKRYADVYSYVNIKSIVIAITVSMLFMLFPPFQNFDYSIPAMGYMDKMFRVFRSDLLRVVFFCVFATLACLRFYVLRIETILILSNVILMAKSHIAWDKYLLPLIVILWFLTAIEYNGKRKPFS
mgnify:CR=1 FL=1|jgi:hypothetical protein